MQYLRDITSELTGNGMLAMQKIRDEAIIIVGCKADMRPLKMREDILRFARANDYSAYVETSAKRRLNCNALLGVTLELAQLKWEKRAIQHRRKSIVGRIATCCLCPCWCPMYACLICIIWATCPEVG